MQPGESTLQRTTVARLVFAVFASTVIATLVVLAMERWLLPHRGGMNFAREAVYGTVGALFGVGLPLTVLHLRQRRSGRESYLAYMVVGAFTFCVVYLAWWASRPWPVRPSSLSTLGLMLTVGGGVGGAIYRLALRASPWRGGMVFLGALVVCCGTWLAGRLVEMGGWPERAGVWRDGRPPPGPMVSGMNDPKLQQLGETIRQLVETGEVDAFANATAAAVEDWVQLLPKSTGAPIEHPLGDDPALSLRRHKRAVADSAEHLTEIARRSGLARDRVIFRVKSVTARSGGMRIYNVAPGQQVRTPALQDVRVFLSGEPASDRPADANLRGDYQIRVGDVSGFPGGWRIRGGVRWVGFPAGVADAATRGELVLTGKVAEDPWDEKRTLALADDPLLGKLGDAFAALLRNRSVPDFVAATRSRREDLDTFARRFEWETPEETEQQFAAFSANITTSAQTILGTMERLGLDFTDAEITLKDATAERVMFGSWTFGSPNGLHSDAIRLTFGVRSTRRSRDGRSIAGDFVLTTGSAVRKSDRWLLWDAQSRWQDLPAALMTKGERERIEFENHVIEHGTLPLGMAAPDIALVRLDTGAKVQLSSYRGKVVVLEWWASWCAPCQPAMTELQELPGAQADWKGRVEVIAVSIDDELALAQAHAAKRQWTKTTNVWAGAGATASESARRFRVDGVPTCYILDRAGRIVFAGHPGGEPMAELVRKALRK